MANYQLHEIIKNRMSPVVYSNKSIESEKIKLLFEAARWAPSSMNEQPWRFIFAQKNEKKEFQNLFDCLLEGNQVWNNNVPLLILTIAKNNFDYQNKPNDHAFYDVASSVANLTFQANAMGLWVHQMAGFDAKKAIANLNIPRGFKPVTMLAVGYMGDIEKAPENLKKRQLSPRKRKSIKEIVYINQWNNIDYKL